MAQNEMNKRLQRLQNFIERDGVKKIMGVLAVNHFKESFDKEGFTDKTLKKWPEVERRKSTSPWYGFKYGVKGISTDATRKNILTQSGNLAESIKWKSTAKGIEVSSDTEYSKVQNEGGNIKIFGKKTTKLPQRQFMGESEALNKKINEMLEKKFKEIMK